MKKTRREEFPTTRWSLITRVRGVDPTTRHQAFAEFCQTYWMPLYCFARRQGRPRHDTEDLVQSFVLHLLNKDDAFAGVAPGTGKLRTWLLVAFRNFMRSDWRKVTAQKRGGETEFVPLDLTPGEEFHEAGLTDDPTPEAVYDRQWARIVLRRARRALREAHDHVGKLSHYDTFKPFLDADCQITPAELAEQLGKSPGAVRMSINRFREDYRKLLRREIADTIGEHDDVEDEMQHLVNCL